MGSATDNLTAQTRDEAASVPIGSMHDVPGVDDTAARLDRVRVVRRPRLGYGDRVDGCTGFDRQRLWVFLQETFPDGGHEAVRPDSPGLIRH